MRECLLPSVRVESKQALLASIQASPPTSRYPNNFPTHRPIGLCVRCVVHLFRALVREVASVSYILVRLETDFPGAVVGDNFSKRSLKQLEDRQATAPGSSASSQFLQVTTLSRSSRLVYGNLLDIEGSSNRIVPSKLHYQASCGSDPCLSQ
jgi:hypothetical protein